MDHFANFKVIQLRCPSEYNIFNRGKAQDIYDLAWAPDSTLLLAGSTDNSASIYHAKTGILSYCAQHALNIGRAMPPLFRTPQSLCARCSMGSFGMLNMVIISVLIAGQGEFIASFSSDRTLRIYTRKKRKPTTKKAKDTQTDPKPETPSSKRVIDKWDLVHIVNKREYSKVDESKDKEDKKDKSETPKKEKEKVLTQKMILCKANLVQESLQHKMFLDENVNTYPPLTHSTKQRTPDDCQPGVIS